MRRLPVRPPGLPVLCRWAVVLVLVLASARMVGAQPPAMPCCAAMQPPGPPIPLRVFVDCDRCDADYIRTSVSFADFVRDRAVADLHVLVTTQGTGGGGLAWTLAFLGQGRFANHDHTMTFSTGSTATNDEQRSEFVRVLKLGLVFYAADTPAGSRLNVTFDRPEGAQTTPAKDPWNYWVFRLGANAYFNGQQSNTSGSYYLNASANRTTERWKYSFNSNSNANGNTFTFDDGTKVKSSTHGWSVNHLLVESVGPHWSIGGTASVSESSYSNENRLYRLAPGIEFDVFPYSQSTRRILTFLYTAGFSHYNYQQVTIFDRLHETVPEQTANASMSLKEPWGSISVSTNFTQQFNKLKRYRLATSSEADVRLFKGFSFNVYFEYDRIRNQIFLPLGDASTEDVLLRVRQLATGYSYYGNFGISYSFGSIFNNVVNPRFSGQ